MNQPFTRRIIWYSSLFITLALNIPRLFALRKEGLIAQIMPFDWVEWTLQLVITFLFCITVFYYSRKKENAFYGAFQWKLHGWLIAMHIFFISGFGLVGAAISRLFFRHGLLPGAGYFLRLTVSSILIGIIFRVLTAIFSAQLKERENQALRNTNLKMELELLKTQLNPHFFFNALSSLSGIVREDPQKAQQYIGHLSKIFRYSLQNAEKNLVQLNEEINDIYSYAQLMKMRYEDGFQLKINIDYNWLTHELPPMSLQPLIENAIKHNIVSATKPLEIILQVENNILEVSNTLQPVSFPQSGTGIGLANLNERFRILSGKEIEIIKTDTTFIVKLPLK